MAQGATHVILNEVKNLIEPTTYKTEILRLTPQNDIATQSRGPGMKEVRLRDLRGESRFFVLSPLVAALPRQALSAEKVPSGFV
jgi:hypothetical protein